MRRLVVAIILPAALAHTFMSCAPAVPDATGGAGGRSTPTGGARVATGGSTASPTGGQVGQGGSGGAEGPSTGGSSNTDGTGGGDSATGGNSGNSGHGGGGAAASGGRGSGGTGSGGAATGGSGPTACNLPNHTGSGSFTHYYFGQGPVSDSPGYRSACGYYVTEGGRSASGPNDTVQNIAKMAPANAMYFAAFPGQNQFNTRNQCGACVQLTGQNGKVIVATIVDECPYGSDGKNAVCANNPNGHLDLSTAAFDQLGYSVGNPTNTNWKFVPCPVTGNVVLQIKKGNDNEVFIQNSILAIKSVARGGEMAVHQPNYSAWHFGAKLNVGDTLHLTDAADRPLDVQVTSTAMHENQDTGKQFPACL
ncbi:MAG: RlpA-like double-psi beta-barrel domain-containing protein [Myxococcales bacterium]